MDGKGRTGAAGERIASEYLELAGCRVIERNYRTGHLEIDIIAADGDCLAFVEVKTRIGRAFGSALEAVGPRKLGNLRRAAAGYLQGAGPHRSYGEIRFDLVAVDVDPAAGRLEVAHLRGIG